MLGMIQDKSIVQDIKKETHWLRIKCVLNANMPPGPKLGKPQQN